MKERVNSSRDGIHHMLYITYKTFGIVLIQWVILHQKYYTLYSKIWSKNKCSESNCNRNLTHCFVQYEANTIYITDTVIDDIGGMHCTESYVCMDEISVDIIICKY